MMIRKIGVCMAKGGTGKTTTAVNLAHALASIGRRVLLIDTDTQNQTGYALGVKPDYGLADLVLGDVSAEDAVYAARDNLDLLCGGQLLGRVKREISLREIRSEMMLTEALTPLLHNYDYVIADSHPSWDTLTVNLMFFVNEVICPVRLEPMALDGIGSFLRQMNGVQQYTENVQLRYIVPIATDRRITQTGEILEQLRDAFPDLLCDEIRYDNLLSKAPGVGQTIFEYARRSNGAMGYAALTQRIIADE